MKNTIAKEVEEMIAGGAVKVENKTFQDADGKPLKVRNMDATNDPLEIGDEITIPQDYEVLLTDINGNQYPCTVAEVKTTDGGERNMRFFPNSLAKVVYPVDAEGKRGPKVKTTGTVAKWYSEKGTVDEAMKELAGKTIVIAGKETYNYRDYNTKEIRSTSVYQYEWKAA